MTVLGWLGSFSLGKVCFSVTCCRFRVAGLMGKRGLRGWCIF